MLADGDHDIDAGPARVLADRRVQRRCVFTELEHLAEQRDPPPPAGAAELIDRGAHRVGVRVVGVVDQDDPAREA